MSNRNRSKVSEDEAVEYPAFRVRLPGFLIDQEVGLGDALKQITYAIGIKPCPGCEQRAALLNRWINFSR
jgi:hypothetical protein